MSNPSFINMHVFFLNNFLNRILKMSPVSSGEADLSELFFSFLLEAERDGPRRVGDDPSSSVSNSSSNYLIYKNKYF